MDFKVTKKNISPFAIFIAITLLAILGMIFYKTTLVTAKNGLERIHIKIAPLLLGEIKKNLINKTPYGVLNKNGKKYFNAKILDSRNHSLNGKIRIKGDNPLHWENLKKSWRVNLKKNNYFKQMNEFDLVIPLDKGFHLEVVIQELGREMGLITPLLKYVALSINNVNRGIHLLYETLNKQMIERSGFDKSLIIKEKNTWTTAKFRKESLYFTSQTKEGLPLPGLSHFVGSFEIIDPYKREKQAHQAFIFFENYLNDLSSISNNERNINLFFEQYFKMDYFLKWYALLFFFHSPHSTFGDNLRFVYDPYQEKLFPVIYDTNLYASKDADGKFSSYSFLLNKFNLSPLLKKRMLTQVVPLYKRRESIFKKLQDVQNLILNKSNISESERILFSWYVAKFEKRFHKRMKDVGALLDESDLI